MVKKLNKLFLMLTLIACLSIFMPLTACDEKVSKIDLTIANTEYIYGDTLNLEDLNLVITYKNKETKNVPITKDMIKTDLVLNTVGEYEIVVNYDGTDYKIKVNVTNPIVNISLVDYKAEYLINDTFVANGKIKIEYKNGNVEYEDITDNMVGLKPDLTTTGNKVVSVSYSNKTYEYTVYVRELSIKEVSLVSLKTNYTTDETFTANGQVKIIYEDDSIRYIDITDDMLISKPDLKTEGNKKISVNYNNKTYQYDIVVTKGRYLTLIESIENLINNSDKNLTLDLDASIDLLYKAFRDEGTYNKNGSISLDLGNITDLYIDNVVDTIINELLNNAKNNIALENMKDTNISMDIKGIDLLYILLDSVVTSSKTFDYYNYIEETPQLKILKDNLLNIITSAINKITFNFDEYGEFYYDSETEMWVCEVNPNYQAILDIVTNTLYKPLFEGNYKNGRKFLAELRNFAVKYAKVDENLSNAVINQIDSLNVIDKNTLSRFLNSLIVRINLDASEEDKIFNNVVTLRVIEMIKVLENFFYQTENEPLTAKEMIGQLYTISSAIIDDSLKSGIELKEEYYIFNNVLTFVYMYTQSKQALPVVALTISIDLYINSLESSMNEIKNIMASIKKEIDYCCKELSYCEEMMDYYTEIINDCEIKIEEIQQQLELMNEEDLDYYDLMQELEKLKNYKLEIELSYEEMYLSHTYWLEVYNSLSADYEQRNEELQYYSMKIETFNNLKNIILDYANSFVKGEEIDYVEYAIDIMNLFGYSNSADLIEKYSNNYRKYGTCYILTDVVTYMINNTEFEDDRVEVLANTLLALATRIDEYYIAETDIELDILDILSNTVTDMINVIPSDENNKYLTALTTACSVVNYSKENLLNMKEVILATTNLIISNQLKEVISKLQLNEETKCKLLKYVDSLCTIDLVVDVNYIEYLYYSYIILDGNTENSNTVGFYYDFIMYMVPKYVNVDGTIFAPFFAEPNKILTNLLTIVGAKNYVEMVLGVPCDSTTTEFYDNFDKLISSLDSIIDSLIYGKEYNFNVVNENLYNLAKSAINYSTTIPYIDTYEEIVRAYENSESVMPAGKIFLAELITNYGPIIPNLTTMIPESLGIDREKLGNEILTLLNNVRDYYLLNSIEKPDFKQEFIDIAGILNFTAENPYYAVFENLISMNDANNTNTYIDLIKQLMAITIDQYQDLVVNLIVTKLETIDPYLDKEGLQTLLSNLIIEIKNYYITGTSDNAIDYNNYAIAIANNLGFTQDNPYYDVFMKLLDYLNGEATILEVENKLNYVFAMENKDALIQELLQQITIIAPNADMEKVENLINGILCDVIEYKFNNGDMPRYTDYILEILEIAEQDTLYTLLYNYLTYNTPYLLETITLEFNELYYFLFGKDGEIADKFYNAVLDLDRAIDEYIICEDKQAQLEKIKELTINVFEALKEASIQKDNVQGYFLSKTILAYLTSGNIEELKMNIYNMVIVANTMSITGIKFTVENYVKLENTINEIIAEYKNNTLDKFKVIGILLNNDLIFNEVVNQVISLIDFDDDINYEEMRKDLESIIDGAKDCLLNANLTNEDVQKIAKKYFDFAENYTTGNTRKKLYSLGVITLVCTDYELDYNELLENVEINIPGIDKIDYSIFLNKFLTKEMLENALTYSIVQTINYDENCSITSQEITLNISINLVSEFNIVVLKGDINLSLTFAEFILGNISER